MHDRAGLSDVIGEMVDYTMSHFAFEKPDGERGLPVLGPAQEGARPVRAQGQQGLCKATSKAART